MFDYNNPVLDELPLTEKQRRALKAYRKYGSAVSAGRVLGITEPTYRGFLHAIRLKYKNAGFILADNQIGLEDKPEGEDVFDLKQKQNALSPVYQKFMSQDRFNLIVTSAQNGTPVAVPFWHNLLKLAEETNAMILVIPFRYKNPTSVFKEYDKVGWATELQDYLCEDDFDLNENLCIIADLKSQPTAVRPLSGLEQVSGSKSAIFGHAKLALKPVATPSSKFPKLLMTTGCCTVPNYTDSKAGYKASKRHSQSAIMVEVKGKLFFTRQVVADNCGNFIDLKKEYRDGEVYPAPKAHLLSTGDLHGVNSDEQAVDATIDMMKFFEPEIMTFDDTLDFQAASHHNMKNPVIRAQLHEKGLNNIKRELMATFAILDRIHHAYPDAEKVVKRSNHDEHFETWVKNANPREDFVNFRIWCEAFPLMVDGVDIYTHYAKKWLSSFSEFRFLERDEQFIVDDVAHDGHGDLGANGARGSLLGFTKLGCAGQWGHSHTPGIMDDQYQNGTLSKLRLAYTRGPSSWAHCNTIQYANGKRSLIFIIDGEWRFHD